MQLHFHGQAEYEANLLSLRISDSAIKHILRKKFARICYFQTKKNPKPENETSLGLSVHPTAKILARTNVLHFTFRLSLEK